MDPNDLIDQISRLIDQAELSRDPYGFMEARRLLNNDLRKAISNYAAAEVQTVLNASFAQFAVLLHRSAEIEAKA